MTYLKKFLINPQRIRKIVGSFSWVDRQFMRSGYLKTLCQEAILLYFFLVIVSDEQGLSFYGEQRICKELKLSTPELEKGRRQLIVQNLIAWQNPMYQVLSVGSPERHFSTGEPTLVKDIISGVLKQKKTGALIIDGQ